jgi:hypothetical protein
LQVLRLDHKTYFPGRRPGRVVIFIIDEIGGLTGLSIEEIQARAKV